MTAQVSRKSRTKRLLKSRLKVRTTLEDGTVEDINQRTVGGEAVVVAYAGEMTAAARTGWRKDNSNYVDGDDDNNCQRCREGQSLEWDEDK